MFQHIVAIVPVQLSDSSQVSVYGHAHSLGRSIRNLVTCTAQSRVYACGRVPDLQSGGCGFEFRPALLRTKVSTQPSIPPGSVNEYQLRLGRQGQVWLISIAAERVWVCR